MTPDTLEPLRAEAAEDMRLFWAEWRFCTRCERLMLATRFRPRTYSVCRDCMNAAEYLRVYWRRVA